MILKGVHPQRRLAIMTVLPVVVGAVYGLYYQPVAERHQQQRLASAQQQDELGTLHERTTILSELRQTRDGSLAHIAELERRLDGAAQVADALDVMAADLDAMGLRLSSFTPSQEGRRERSGADVRRDYFQVIFEADYHHVVELLGKWRSLPFDLRVRKVVLNPIEDGAAPITVILQCVLTTRRADSREEER